MKKLWSGSLLLLLLVTGRTAAQELADALAVVPAPAKAIWQVPGAVVLPLRPLLERGMVLLQRKGIGGADLALVRLETGETLWSVGLGGEVVAANIAGDVILIGLRDRVAGFALADGTTLWRQPLNAPVDSGWSLSPQFVQSQWFADRSIATQGIGGGLHVIGDRLFLCVLGTIYSLDATTGEIAWRRKLCFSLSHPLRSHGGTLLVATLDQGFGALAGADGKTAWSQPFKSARAVFSVDDEVYVATAERGLARLDPADGRVVWSSALSPEPTMKLTAVGTRLVVQQNKAVLVLDRQTGEQLWQATTPPLLSVLRDDLVCYRDGDNGPLVARSVGDGAERWRTRLGTSGAGSLHVAGGALLALAPSAVQAFDLTSGAALWSRAPGPGLLFDSNTWSSTDEAVFVHVATETRGYGLKQGEYVLRVPGHAFFIHWMAVRQGTLYLHSGSPGQEALAALPLQPRER